MMLKCFKGDAYTVTHCKGAMESLATSLKSVTPVKKQKSMLITLRLQIERLASGKRSAELNIRKEGGLPSYNGKEKKNFWAIKKIPIRGYFWESERVEMTYFISHYVYKDYDNLRDSDVKRVCSNWHRIERYLDDD